MSLRFQVEWLDAPSITDVVDAATWGRLTIGAHTQAGDWVSLTQAIDGRTHQARDGVVGSWFSLARWLVDSYWNLLFEERRFPELQSGRKLSGHPLSRPWIRRHCVLTAREGQSLPDLSISADGERIIVAVFPDDGSCHRTGRALKFVAEEMVRMERAQVEDGIRAFIEDVLERTRKVEHADIYRLRDDWNAILDSRQNEFDLCALSARVGVDPYDQVELTESLQNLIEAQVTKLAVPLRSDLLDSLDRIEEMRSTLDWVCSNAGTHRPGRVSRRYESDISSESVGSAYQVGYQKARELRQRLGVNPTDGNVQLAAKNRLKFGLADERHSEQASPSTIDGIVSINEKARPVIVGPELPHANRMFRWARALHFWTSGYLQDSPRLITRSHARVQREGRAFAAELLAPAAALGVRIKTNFVRASEINELAEEFGVLPVLIEHQLENHGIAAIDRLM